MKIENNKKDDQIRFSSLALGDCFKHTGELYLRIESILDSEGEIEYNSVMLADGALTFFDDDYWVHSVDAKIVIE